MSSHLTQSRLLLRTLIASAIFVGLAGSADAQEVIGKTNKIKNQVTGSVGQRTLSIADPVYRNENIAAAANSFGEIILNDDSKILVGEDTVLTLDEFVLAADGSFESATFRLAKGAVRFLGSENSKPDAFKFRTPTGTVGIRGTSVEIYVRE